MEKNHIRSRSDLLICSTHAENDFVASIAVGLLNDLTLPSASKPKDLRHWKTARGWRVIVARRFCNPQISTAQAEQLRGFQTRKSCA